MSNVLKERARTLYTAIGGSMPTAKSDHRGELALKRAASTEDEVYVGVRDASSAMAWRLLSGGYVMTLGPWGVANLAGTSNSQGFLPFLNSASAFVATAEDLNLRVAGEIVGCILASNAARTAGTCTMRVRVAGTPTAFNSGAVALDGTNTTKDASFVAPGSGVSFSATDAIGVDLQTSGWTPTTADFTMWLVVRLRM